MKHGIHVLGISSADVDELGILHFGGNPEVTEQETSIAQSLHSPEVGTRGYTQRKDWVGRKDLMPLRCSPLSLLLSK